MTKNFAETAQFTEGQQAIIDEIPMRRTPTDWQRQFIAGNGDCSICGGTHYGAQNCPYRCAKCGVNTDPCERMDCPNAAIDAQIAARKK